jgi:hypothetical protein
MTYQYVWFLQEMLAKKDSYQSDSSLWRKLHLKKCPFPLGPQSRENLVWNSMAGWNPVIITTRALGRGVNEEFICVGIIPNGFVVVEKTPSEKAPISPRATEQSNFGMK